MNKCEFCKKLKGMIDNRDPPFDKKNDAEIVVFTTSINNALNEDISKTGGYCRGFRLCSKHIKTIKDDNKYRIKKGIDIPATLEVMHIFNKDY